MLLLNVHRDGPKAIYKQIHDQIIEMVDGGALPSGTRLPPTRVLASTLGVNRSTVCRAYQELWALGYLESRAGSYSTVRARSRPLCTGARSGDGLIDWDRASSEESRHVHGDLLRLPRHSASASTGEIVNFSSLSADRALCPTDEFRRAVKQVLLANGREILDYGDPAGYRPLREVIARRMRTHGVSVSAEEILITNGSQHALDLVLRLLTRQGGAIAVESPTYSMAVPLLRLHGLRVRELPMRDDGLDLGALERLLAEETPALVYTIPSFHNPTGITTGQAHRERLLGLCEAHRVPLVEDGFEEEMKYFGAAVLPIKSMDASGIVIYLGTFSKVIFPGLRIGWIAADRACIQRLLAISRFSCLSGNMLGQAAVARFCEAGRYEEHVRRVHKAYRRRMQTMLRGLKEHPPERGVEWTQPAGGYTLLVRVTDTTRNEGEIIEQLERAGVLVYPGSLFFAGDPGRPSFRLSICNQTEEQIEEGCRRLGRALARVVEV